VQKIYASQDVYFSLESEKVSRDDTILRCEVNVTGEGGHNLTYPGVPMVQFNISGLKIGEDDIGILVLKAESVKEDGDSGMVAVVPVDSDWDESSEFLELALNLPPLWKSMKKDELAGQIGIDSDDDKIFAFDVSGKLREAKGGKISFFLEAVSNSSYRADFKSRESGEGPYLMVIPYPSVLRIDLTKNLTPNLTQNLTLNQTLTSNQPLNQTSNLSIDQRMEDEPLEAGGGNDTSSAPEVVAVRREEMRPLKIQEAG
jgi:hypothetical protein